MSQEIYDKVYFHDEYSRQFSELRERYHDRTQQALHGRSVDKAPVANATTVVFMEDTHDGGVTVTTGDFVAYFNRRFERDRIGEMRRSLSAAEQKVELKRAREKMAAQHKQELKKRSAKAKRPAAERAPRFRFSFAHALLALMLVLSMVMFFGTSALLENTVDELRAMEKEANTMQADAGVEVAAYAVEVPESRTLCGTDSVEVYEPEEAANDFSVSALLNALAALW